MPTSTGRDSVSNWLSIALALIPLIVVAVVVALRNEPPPGVTELMTLGALVVGFPAAGVMMLRRNPSNVSGWSVLGACALIAGSFMFSVWGMTSGSGWIAWVGGWMLPLGLGGLVIPGLFLYPNGSVRSPFDRWVLRIGGSVVLLAAVVEAFGPEVGSGMASPVTIGHDLATSLQGPVQSAFGLTVGVILVAKFVGNRRRPDHQRTQLAALGWVALIVVGALVVGFALATAGLDSTLVADGVRLLTWFAVGCLPLVMILGEIAPRRWLHTAVVYTALSMVVVAIHGAAVASVVLVLPVEDPTPVVLIAAAAVAVIVQPIRIRVQHFVDRFSAGREAGLDPHTVRKRERERLSRDLHDSLGSSLTAIGLGVQRARELIATDPIAAARHLDSVAGETGVALSEVRRVIRDANPRGLERGLRSAVEDLAERVGILTASRVEIQIDDGLPALSDAVEVAAYRVIEEAVTNSIRHSHATTCTIAVWWHDALVVQVVDNGTGMTANGSMGTGLASMRQRVHELGGDFEILSDSGLTVRASIPMVPA